MFPILKKFMIIVAFVCMSSFGHASASVAAFPDPSYRTGVDIRRMERLMEDAFNKSNIDKITGKDVVLFLGNTQVGKSTLINYLLGVSYKKRGPELSVLSGIEVAPRGTGSASATLFPEVYEKDGLNYCFCDTQGFGDTRGKEEEVVSSILLEMVVNAARSVKIVVPFTETELEAGAKGIRDFCHTSDNLFSSRNIPILFSYNRKNPSWNLDYVREKMDNLYESERQRLIDLGVESGGIKDVVVRFAKQLCDNFWSSEPNHPAEEIFSGLALADCQNFLHRQCVKEQIDKISTLWMVKKMQKAYDDDCLFYVDIVKSEESGRNNFFSRLRYLGCVEKKHFRFSKLSGHRPYFDAQTCQLLQDFRSFLELKRNFERYKSYAPERLINLENMISLLEFKKSDLDRKRRSGEYLPEIEQQCGIIRGRYESLNQELVETTNNLDRAVSEKASKESQIVDLQSPGHPIFYKTIPWEKEGFWLPLIGYCGAYYNVNYDDLPFCESKEELGPDTQIEGEKTEDKKKGIFKSCYGTKYKNYSSGKVNFYQERKEHAETKVRLRTLQGEVEELKRQIERLKEKTVERQSELGRVQEDLSRTQREGEDGVERLLRNINNREREAIEILEKLRIFLIDYKNLEAMNANRVDVWYKISRNLQKTGDHSSQDSIASMFINEYDRRQFGAIDAVDPVIECSITQEYAEQFIKLPCGHILSQEGYDGLLAAASPRNGSRCHECRAEFVDGDTRTIVQALCEVQFDDLRRRQLDTLELLSSRFNQMRSSRNALFFEN